MIIIMLGAPGTGKGTVAGILQEKKGFKQISTGDIFRKNIKEQTELGKIADSYISKGNLVPDDITVELVKSVLDNEDIEKDSMQVHFDAIGLDSVNINIYMYTNIINFDDFLNFKEKVNEDILKVLESENIKMAYPGQNVYVHNVDEGQIVTEKNS